MSGRIGLEGVPAEAVLLPRGEVRIGRYDSSHVAAALHALDGVLYWTKWPLADLPNDLIGIEDLERLGIAAHRI